GRPLVPWRRGTAHLALARHAHPHRQRFTVLLRVVDHDLPRRVACATRAVGHHAGLLAARRPEPSTELNNMPDTDALLEVRNLRVEFHTRRGVLTALDNVSFDIARGEILGVVGESGAGKSLTGTAIIGLLEPPGRIAAGEIRLGGRRI